MFGVRLFLSDLGVVKDGKETIVDQCRTYIVDLKESNRLPDMFHDKTEDIWALNAYGGYQFTNATTAEFQEIKEFYSKAIYDSAMERLPAHGKNLMELLKKDAIGFLRRLCLNAYEQSPYLNVPILATIEPEQFANTVLELPPEPQRIVFSALKARYERGGLENDLSSEGPWLQTVRKLLLRKVENEHPIIAFRIKSFIGHSVDPTLNRSLRKRDPEPKET